MMDGPTKFLWILNWGCYHIPVILSDLLITENFTNAVRSHNVLHKTKIKAYMRKDFLSFLQCLPFSSCPEGWTHITQTHTHTHIHLKYKTNQIQLCGCVQFNILLTSKSELIIEKMVCVHACMCPCMRAMDKAAVFIICQICFTAQQETCNHSLITSCDWMHWDTLKHIHKHTSRYKTNTHTYTYWWNQ